MAGFSGLVICAENAFDSGGMGPRCVSPYQRTSNHRDGALGVAGFSGLVICAENAFDSGGMGPRCVSLYQRPWMRDMKS